MNIKRQLSVELRSTFMALLSLQVSTPRTLAGSKLTVETPNAQEALLEFSNLTTFILH